MASHLVSRSAIFFIGKNDTMAGTHHHSKRAEFKVEFERGGDTVRDPARSAFLEIP